MGQRRRLWRLPIVTEVSCREVTEGEVVGPAKRLRWSVWPMSNLRFALAGRSESANTLHLLLCSSASAPALLPAPAPHFVLIFGSRSIDSFSFPTQRNKKIQCALPTMHNCLHYFYHRNVLS